MQYEIVGTSFPVVVCHLAAGERMKTERGSMAWMDPWIDMRTETGGFASALGRMFSGESIFENVYTAQRPGKIAFGSSFPGRIMALDIGPGREAVVQKMSFLASEAGVELSVQFNERLGAGFFGGEGFIMQRLSGQGTAFVEVDGDLMAYELASGEQLVVDTGRVLGFTPSVSMDIRSVRGVRNALAGGEGLFNTVMTGPGTVWLQTMPLANLADAILVGRVRGAKREALR